jgi:large subunit ribosomal protein L30
MSKIKITQVKSGIDRMAKQKRTLVALGIRKMHHSVEVEGTPQILGMVRAVNHLVKVEQEVNGAYQVIDLPAVNFKVASV